MPRKDQCVAFRVMETTKDLAEVENWQEVAEEHSLYYVRLEGEIRGSVRKGDLLFLMPGSRAGSVEVEFCFEKSETSFGSHVAMQDGEDGHTIGIIVLHFKLHK